MCELGSSSNEFDRLACKYVYIKFSRLFYHKRIYVLEGLNWLNNGLILILSGQKQPDNFDEILKVKAKFGKYLKE